MTILACARFVLKTVAAVLLLDAAAAAQAPAGHSRSSRAKPHTERAEPDATGAQQPTLLGQYGEWRTYTAKPGGEKLCFALAKPTSSQITPKRPRDPVYLFVTSRPVENVRNEVSVVMGYAFKPGSEANLEIGSAKFAMYTQSDGAWIKNAAEESRLVDTMRKGQDLVVTGMSSRGTQSVDRYSLKGLSQALDRAAQECR
jgi:invasion protein IalB